MRKNVGWIQIVTFPVGAAIFIDGKPAQTAIVKLNADKNHELLIKAMKGIDGKLLIIGNGELYSKLNALIIDYGVQHKVNIEKKLQ